MLDHPPNEKDPPATNEEPAATDDELAEHFGVSVEAVRALEKDEREELSEIRRFARLGLCRRRPK